MLQKIGFTAEDDAPVPDPSAASPVVPPQEPRKCLARIYFPARNAAYFYYNDRFELKKDDLVFVDGKLEGLPGWVAEISYNFRIHPADYQRVIFVADPRVTGTFYPAGSHLLTFCPETLPWEKVSGWLRPPSSNEDDYVSSYDDSSVPLEELSRLELRAGVADRGLDYFRRCRVSYLELCGSQGRALVEGSQPYDVEFHLENGMISHLTCTCPCGYTCKHSVAALLQLRETLTYVTEANAARFRESGYLAAISKQLLFRVALDCNCYDHLTISDQP